MESIPYYVNVKLYQYADIDTSEFNLLLVLLSECSKTNYFVTFGNSARSTITLDLCECMQMNHNKMSALKVDCRMQKIGEEKNPSSNRFICTLIQIFPEYS